MLQFNAKVGDSVKVGDLNFKILGTLTKAPGQTGIGASIAPTVYIPLQLLDKTNLIKTGSRINNKFYFRYNDPSGIDAWVKKRMLSWKKRVLMPIQLSREKNRPEDRLKM
ncbi:hypothetical protein [Pedobacter sp. P26]|uniref:hypothetical protein n=1 Tax=Pedobacter sp. P26 TaxID=3423956 RepID=UPI003D678B2B